MSSSDRFYRNGRGGSGSPRMARSLVAVLLLAMHSACAYMPASSTNNTDFITVSSLFAMQANWLPTGSVLYLGALSRQLASNVSTPSNVTYLQGAFVQFDETSIDTASNPNRSLNIPWVALISCDPDGNTTTNSSTDILTTAATLGAEAAILTSRAGQTCVIDSDYAAAHNGSIDVFIPVNRGATSVLYRLFGAVPSDAQNFNATLMEASAFNIANTMSLVPGGGSLATSSSLTAFGSTSATSAAATGSSTPQSRGTAYLLATIARANNFGTLITPGSNGGTVSTQQQQTGNSNTGLAMIILYAITGCVTLLFLVVIMSGALRAVRHPERYGPRARNLAGTGDRGQSRAGGLAKAILDTFPVVKFGNRGSQPTDVEGHADAPGNGSNESAKDDDEGEVTHTEVASLHSGGPSAPAAKASSEGVRTSVEHVKMVPLRSSLDASTSAAQVTHLGHRSELSDATMVGSDIAHKKQATATSVDTAGASQSAAPTAASDTVESREAATDAGAARPEGWNGATLDGADPNDVNDSITCPICLLDFEEGEDIRILPCDARHRFHDECVVPWLLNVSSLCPLCRFDFAQPAEGADAEANAEPAAPTPAGSRNLLAEAFIPESIRDLLHPRTGRAARERTSVNQTPHPFAVGNISSRMGAGAQSMRVVSRQDTSRNSASTPAGDSETGASGDASVNEGDVRAAIPAGRSRFLRYVQQQRQRVRVRSGSTSAGTADVVPASPTSSQPARSTGAAIPTTPSRRLNPFNPMRRLSSNLESIAHRG